MVHSQIVWTGLDWTGLNGTPHHSAQLANLTEINGGLVQLLIYPKSDKKKPFLNSQYILLRNLLYPAIKYLRTYL